MQHFSSRLVYQAFQKFRSFYLQGRIELDLSRASFLLNYVSWANLSFENPGLRLRLVLRRPIETTREIGKIGTRRQSFGVTGKFLLSDLTGNGVPQSAATSSISTNASLGNPATCTVERAGAATGKYFAYTSFIAAKSFMSFRKTVVFTT